MHALLHYANLHLCGTFSTLFWIALNISHADKSTALVNFCLTHALIQEINAEGFQLFYQPIGKLNPKSLLYIEHPFLVMSLRVFLLKKVIVFSGEQRIANFDLKVKNVNIFN